jgi:hypothetical protein
MELGMGRAFDALEFYAATNHGVGEAFERFVHACLSP